jgi:hypothetical protein
MAVIRHEAWGAARKPGGASRRHARGIQPNSADGKRYALLAFHLANQCVAERCEILIR